MNVIYKAKIRQRPARANNCPVLSLQSIKIQFASDSPINFEIKQGGRIQDQVTPVDPVLLVATAGSSTTTMVKL